MSDRSNIEGDSPRLVYSCRCGWLDLGHMDGKSYRFGEGAESLWKQISVESGVKSRKDSTGFKVVYKQKHGRYGFRTGETRTYFVKYGLSKVKKGSVALAIFMEVSLGFESLQANWFYRPWTDSGYSAEDLVSNLLGFYKTIRPELDINQVCGVVGQQASLNVWDTYGAVGSLKNQSFEPLLFVCPMMGTHTHGKHVVTVTKDGQITVQKGDTLSGYSAAMYKGEASHIDEFGRMVNGAVHKLANPHQIRVGETLYHIPTYKVSLETNPKGEKGKLPSAFPQIAGIEKGEVFRDWTIWD